MDDGVGVQTMHEAEDEWTAWWNARVAAMDRILGPHDDLVGHATVPFDVGADLGGAADIVYFQVKPSGVVAVTSELIGRDDQVENQLGNYELMICERSDAEWGAGIISRLAYYTLEAELNPGETVGLGDACPEGSPIVALLFFDYARFEVLGRSAGLLLCVGITEDELQACQDGRRLEVEHALRSASVYPFTDLFRDSVLSHGRGPAHR